MRYKSYKAAFGKNEEDRLAALREMRKIMSKRLNRYAYALKGQPVQIFKVKLMLEACNRIHKTAVLLEDFNNPMFLFHYYKHNCSLVNDKREEEAEESSSRNPKGNSASEPIEQLDPSNENEPCLFYDETVEMDEDEVVEELLDDAFAPDDHVGGGIVALKLSRGAEIDFNCKMTVKEFDRLKDQLEGLFPNPKTLISPYSLDQALFVTLTHLRRDLSAEDIKRRYFLPPTPDCSSVIKVILEYLAELALPKFPTTVEGWAAVEAEFRWERGTPNIVGKIETTSLYNGVDKLLTVVDAKERLMYFQLISIEIPDEKVLRESGLGQIIEQLDIPHFEFCKGQFVAHPRFQDDFHGIIFPEDLAEIKGVHTLATGWRDLLLKSNENRIANEIERNNCLRSMDSRTRAGLEGQIAAIVSMHRRNTPYIVFDAHNSAVRIGTEGTINDLLEVADELLLLL